MCLLTEYIVSEEVGLLFLALAVTLVLQESFELSGIVT